MSTNIKDLDKSIQEGKLNSLYVLYGEETYLIEEYLRKIKKTFGELSTGINYITHDEKSISTIISDIETPSFGYEKKLIVVRNSGIFKKDYKEPIKEKLVEYIKDNKELLDESCVIVFIEDTVHKFEMYKTVEPVGIVIEFQELKPIQLVERLKKICAMYKVKVLDKNLQYLIEISGTNMQDLINEIRKLIEFAGPGGEITKDAIEKLANKQIQAVIFDLTDSLGTKNSTKALETLDGLIYNKEPVQKIIVVLYNHFKKIYLTKMALKEKKNVQDVLDLKPNQTFLSTKYINQSRYFSEEEIRQLLDEIIDLDYKYKIGLIDIDVGLKSILCKNC